MENINLPKIIFGTSSLGNLYVALRDSEKCAIVKECIRHSALPVVFDTAGKYGAGLALESLGKCLRQLGVNKEDVVISNKLGWYRIPLTTAEPGFEPGVWKDLKFDAEQRISYQGILYCFEQGNQLLNGYHTDLVSVHDPDEYLAGAQNENERRKRFTDIKEAYRALFELKAEGKVKAVGAGAKNWKVIKMITDEIRLDWIMIANSLTIKTHPEELLHFITEMKQRGVQVINSAVFHSGFLVGGSFYDYRAVSASDPADKKLFQWREDFFQLCRQFNVKPAEACAVFALNIPGVAAIALNTSDKKRVKENIEMAEVNIPREFWHRMKERGLISPSFDHL